MFLVIENRHDAEISNNFISQKMDLHGDITLKWADITETSDNKFAFLKPDSIYMENVSGYIELENISEDSIFDF